MKKKIFVLDTNVLMHDPSCLFRFEEHDIYIPMVVLEELDNGKKGTSETSRNVRQVSRFLDSLMHGKDHAQIEKGIPLPTTLNKGPNGNGNGHANGGTQPIDHIHVATTATAKGKIRARKQGFYTQLRQY